MNPLTACLLLSSLLFAIGLAGALTRSNAILVLVGIELMLNAANLNFIAFWRYGPNSAAQNGNMTGVLFALFSISVAAAEAAVGLSIILAAYRKFRTTDLDHIDAIKG